MAAQLKPPPRSCRKKGLTNACRAGAVKDDEATLRAVGITQGAKVMLIGSSIDEVVKVNLAPDQPLVTQEAGILPSVLSLSFIAKVHP